MSSQRSWLTLKSLRERDVSLQCETSRSDSPEKWCKDGKSVRNSSKYNIRQSGFEAKLVIHGAEERGSDRCGCEAGAAKSSAVITVKGKNFWSDGLGPYTEHNVIN